VITRAQKLSRQLHEAPARVLAMVLWRLMGGGVLAGCAYSYARRDLPMTGVWCVQDGPSDMVLCVVRHGDDRCAAVACAEPDGRGCSVISIEPANCDAEWIKQ